MCARGIESRCLLQHFNQSAKLAYACEFADFLCARDDDELKNSDVVNATREILNSNRETNDSFVNKAYFFSRMHRRIVVVVMHGP